VSDEKPKKAVSSVEDRVKEIEKKLAKHKEQEQKLNAMKRGIINRDKEKERKARTRRLIQNGALAEQYLKCDGIEPEKFERFLKMAVEHKGFCDYVEKCIAHLDAAKPPITEVPANSPVTASAAPIPGSMYPPNVTPASSAASSVYQNYLSGKKGSN